MTLLDALDQLTAPGDLYEVVDEAAHKIRCYACAHRCLLKDGRRGICQVRYNDGGVLRVPRGYVGALQVDPVEKKPFYHLLPGDTALSFGMLGCDLHCEYCFVGDTLTLTDRGPMTFESMFTLSKTVITKPDGKIGILENLRAMAASGSWQNIKAVYKHPYSGRMAIIQPYYLPELQCTVGHKVYATHDPQIEPIPIEARFLQKGHYLAIPRNYKFSQDQIIDAVDLIGDHKVTYKVAWKLTQEQRHYIIEASKQGKTSKQLGEELGIHPSYIRHVRSKIARGRGGNYRTKSPTIENGKLRFPNECQPGIPLTLPLDKVMARLLGFYCAEGSIVSEKDRPNSYNVCFAFSLDESHFAHEIVNVLQSKFGMKARITKRETTLGVDISKASLALLFCALAGKGAAGKFVPVQLFDAPRDVVKAFVDAYIAGDGHRYKNGKVTVTTVSTNLAYGIAALALKLGFLPSIYKKEIPANGVILGRKIKRSPYQYTIVWYEDAAISRRMIETEQYYLIPIKDIAFENYEGDVYNMEVDIEHNYLAGFFLVKNCQNWDISQAGRDDRAGRDPMAISADQLIRLGQERGAGIVASTYNEPLITTEWAVEIFKLAKAAGMKTAYVSNGNATPEVLDYLSPHLDAYKIDLKSMRDRAYRELGAVLQHILDTIQQVHARGLWLEVVTLVIPGFNDSTEELWDMARFLQGISPDIPWHVTAYRPAYKMADPPATPLDTLVRAAEIGSEAGLRYVYAGNRPGATDEWEHTRCPTCSTILIQRHGFHVIANRLAATGGTCPQCGTAIAGVWT